MGRLGGQNAIGGSSNSNKKEKKKRQSAVIKPAVILVAVGDGSKDSTEGTHLTDQVNVLFGKFELLYKHYQAFQRREDF